MKLLGVKFLGHDSAFALIDTDKKTIFAVSTERVTRIKHDWIDVSVALESFNVNDFDYCCHSFSNFECMSDTAAWTLFDNEKNLALRGILRPRYIKDLAVTKSQKNHKLLSGLLLSPTLVLSYLLNKIRSHKLRRMSNQDAAVHKAMLREYSARKLNISETKVLFYDHHLCHAAAAYYLSPYVGKTALSLTLDGQGDGSFSKLFVFSSQNHKLIGNSKADRFEVDGQEFVTSIGELYSNFTEALGLRRLSDEGKVEAMAAYALKDSEIYKDLRDAVCLSNKSIAFDVVKLSKFYQIEYLRSLVDKVGEKVFSATIQTFLEDVVVEYLNLIGHDNPNIDTLCLSGGVAANIIMSLNVYERTQFKSIYVLPPMGDEGTALGSAILCALEKGQDLSWLSDKYMPYYGDEISPESIISSISKFKDQIEAEWMGDNWHKDAAQAIADGKVIALVNGRMEFGPRALGNRSIVANPSLQVTRDRINSTIKKRPSYQPFCPSILEVERERLFSNSFPHKHMAIAFRMKEEYHQKLPSAIHVDGTARPQFVEEIDNQDYYKFLVEVKNLTGFGVVLNTSFNLHGRTMVRTSDDAITDFLDCNLDLLFIGGYKIRRANNLLVH